MTAIGASLAPVGDAPAGHEAGHRLGFATLLPAVFCGFAVCPLCARGAAAVPRPVPLRILSF